MSEEKLKAIADSLAKIEALLRYQLGAPDAALLADGHCFRWETTASFGGRLTAMQPPEMAPLSELVGLEEQIRPIEQNTRLFLQGREANNALLTGPRGCGKSSVIRGVFAKHMRRGLRLIETDAYGLDTLPALISLVARRPEKFILYCDDLSFGDNPHMFSALKSAIEGALSSARKNLLLYATSNRRNLVAEKFCDNLAPVSDDGDINPMETADEKMALADRFGLWVPFYAPDQDAYDNMLKHWLKRMGIKAGDALIKEGRRFADERGSRNGRIARHFAVIAAGRRR